MTHPFMGRFKGWRAHMARTINKLSPRRIVTLQTPGMYGDGAGLFLNIGPTGSKSWIFRFSSPTVRRRNRPELGQQRDMGLGALHTISLAEARQRAAEARQMVRQGIDPLDVRKDERAQQQLAAARAKTFDECMVE